MIDWSVIKSEHVITACQLYRDRDKALADFAKNAYLHFEDNWYPVDFICNTAYFLATGMKLKPKDLLRPYKSVVFLKRLGFDAEFNSNIPSKWTQKVLVTAGHTNVPIDKVRSLSNIFKGKTGHAIASYFHQGGHDVTLLTSNDSLPCSCTRKVIYNTYDDLHSLMKQEVTMGHYDIIIHSAAVSDYQIKSVCTVDVRKIEDLLYCLDGFRRENADGNSGIANDWLYRLTHIADELGMHPFQLVNNTAKISSKHDTLFLELMATEKLIDKIRADWGFEGILVKFKLQVGLSDKELLSIANESLKTSNADYIVANCLEWARERAYILDEHSHYLPTARKYLPENLYEIVLNFSNALTRLSQCTL